MSTPNSWQLNIDSGVTALTLTFLTQTTPSLTDFSAGGIQSALASLSSVGSGNASVFANADGSLCVTITADLGVTTQDDALTGSGTGGNVLVRSISQAEATTRAQLISMDAANAPILAAAAATLQSKLNAVNGAGSASASWTLTIGAGTTSFTLTFNGKTTGSITVSGLTAATIQTDLQGLATIGSGNCTVTANQDGTYTITLAGGLANTPASGLLNGNGTGGTVTVTQTNNGSGLPGADQNLNIQSAQASFNSALSAATAAMSSIASSLTTSQSETSAISNPTDQSTAIAAITTASNAIADVNASSNPGSGDVLASDINSQLATLVDQVQSGFGAVVTGMTALNTQILAVATALTHVKNHAGAINNVASQFNTLVQPGDQDTEADKQAKLAIIQGLA